MRIPFNRIARIALVSCLLSELLQPMAMAHERVIPEAISATSYLYKQEALLLPLATEQHVSRFKIGQRLDQMTEKLWEALLPPDNHAYDRMTVPSNLYEFVPSSHGSRAADFMHDLLSKFSMSNQDRNKYRMLEIRATEALKKEEALPFDKVRSVIPILTKTKDDLKLTEQALEESTAPSELQIDAVLDYEKRRLNHIHEYVMPHEYRGLMGKMNRIRNQFSLALRKAGGSIPNQKNEQAPPVELRPQAPIKIPINFFNFFFERNMSKGHAVQTFLAQKIIDDLYQWLKSDPNRAIDIWRCFDRSTGRLLTGLELRRQGSRFESIQMPPFDDNLEIFRTNPLLQAPRTSSGGSGHRKTNIGIPPMEGGIPQKGERRRHRDRDLSLSLWIAFMDNNDQREEKTSSPLIRIDVGLWSEAYSARNVVEEMRLTGLKTKVAINVWDTFPDDLELTRIRQLFKDVPDVHVVKSKDLSNEDMSRSLKVQFNANLQVARVAPGRWILPTERLKTWTGPIPQTEIDQLATDIGVRPDEKIIVIGSANHEEANDVMMLIRGLRRAKGPVRVLLVPRAIGRIPFWQRKANDYGIELDVREMGPDKKPRMRAAPKHSVMLFDTEGELRVAYALARRAMIGNTFRQGGMGHNVMEPVVQGAFVFFGPQVAQNKALAAYVLHAKVPESKWLICMMRYLR
jgi:hypothetical protein